MLYLNLLQAEAPMGGGQNMTTLIAFGAIFLIFYFMIIRPQNKRQKETKKMLEALKKGDKVVSIGGIRGVVHTVKDDTILVTVDNDVKMEFNRSAISDILNKVDEKKGK